MNSQFFVLHKICRGLQEYLQKIWCLSLLLKGMLHKLGSKMLDRLDYI